LINVRQQHLEVTQISLGRKDTGLQRHAFIQVHHGANSWWLCSKCKSLGSHLEQIVKKLSKLLWTYLGRHHQWIKYQPSRASLPLLLEPKWHFLLASDHNTLKIYIFLHLYMLYFFPMRNSLISNALPFSSWEWMH